MSYFDDMVQDVMTRCAGAPETTATLFVTNALREFYVHSGSLIRDCLPIVLQDDKVDYVIPPQPDGAVIYIYGGKVNTRWLGLKTSESLLSTTTGTSITRIWAPSQSAIRVEPVPSGINPNQNELIIVAALQPETLADVPLEVYTYHYDVIIDGAIGRGYMMPDKPWSNVKTATYHLRRFRNGMASARDVARRKYTSADTPVQFPPWA